MTILDYVEKVDAARVYDVARVTALDRARRLSDRLGAEVYLKREDTQDVHSFKIRGAYGDGAVSTAQSREIARALDETLNLQMTTAEERRRFMD